MFSVFITPPFGNTLRAFTWICLLGLLHSFAYSKTLSEKIDMLIDQRLPHATIGIVVKNLKTGQVMYSKNAAKLLSPASAMKLLTAAAALYQLGPTYRFVTTLSRKEQDVYLTFAGAPDLTVDQLKRLLSTLKKTRVIEGNIILDISRFQPPYYTNGVSYDDLGWYYAAPETAVILNGNAVAYDVVSAKTVGLPVRVLPKTSENALTIINQVITTNRPNKHQLCTFNIEIQPKNTLRLFGCLTKTPDPVTMQFSIPDPVLFATRSIHHILQTQQIALKGQIIVGQTPPDATRIASVESADLMQLVTHMLKESDNLYANSLTRTLGYVRAHTGSSLQGALEIKHILSQHTHLEMAQLAIADGMGSRYNLTTPQQLVTLLTDLYDDHTMKPIFLQALPQSGTSGSLKERMKKTNLAQIVFAKTGTMHDLSSLSGYLLNPHADPVVFAMMINGVNTPIRTAKDLEERILHLINDASSVL